MVRPLCFLNRELGEGLHRLLRGWLWGIFALHARSLRITIAHGTGRLDHVACGALRVMSLVSGSVGPPSAIDDIRQQMTDSGSGSAGIVWGAGEVGRVFNVVN